MDDLVERLSAERDTCVCIAGWLSYNHTYPCAIDCPCALRDRVISDADRIEALEAEVASLRNQAEIFDREGLTAAWMMGARDAKEQAYAEALEAAAEVAADQERVCKEWLCATGSHVSVYDQLPVVAIRIRALPNPYRSENET